MAVVTFVAHDGEKHEAGLVEGRSLMQIATDNAVPGIDGDCGGRNGLWHLPCDRRPAVVRRGGSVRCQRGGDAGDEPRA